MKKQLTFDALPSAIGKILELLTAEGSEHAALPELVQRITLLEKKIDYLQKSLSPDRPVMDTQTVCRVLKLRPKAVSELAASGALPFRTEGRRTLFYEDAVVKYFMTQPVWNAPAPAPAKRAYTKRAAQTEPAAAVAAASEPDGRRRTDINGAAEITQRSLAAVYQLTSTKKIPHHKEGTKVYFYTDELRDWAKSHPPRPRGKKSKPE